MKKYVFTLLSILLLLTACKADSPSVVGVWKGNAPMFGTESDLHEVYIIFYEGIEAQEDQITTDGTRTYTKTYQFDYETDGTTLTVYVGSVQTAYSVAFGEANGTETMTLTAQDGTAYSYVLISRRTPGIRQY